MTRRGFLLSRLIAAFLLICSALQQQPVFFQTNLQRNRMPGTFDHLYEQTIISYRPSVNKVSGEIQGFQKFAA